MCEYMMYVYIYIHCKYLFVHTHNHVHIHTYILRIKKGCLNKFVQELESLSHVFKIFKYLKTPLLHCA